MRNRRLENSGGARNKEKPCARNVRGEVNEMERLTIKPKATDGIVYLVATDEPCVDICAYMDGECDKECPINEAYKRLAAYEDTGKTPEEVAALVRAENEGRSVKLPVAEGSEIWAITPDGRGPYCANAVISSITNGQVIMEAVWFTGERESVYFDNLGHIVHRTFEAAEAALAEMEGKRK